MSGKVGDAVLPSKPAAAIAAAGFISCYFSAGCGLGAEQGERWTVSQAPEVEIGVLEGEDVYLFDGIAGGRFLPDGRIAVADAGYLEIRIFEPDGSIDVRMGGRGGGPGEFQDIRGMWLTPENRIAVWDATNRRITTFGSDGELHNTARVGGAVVGGNLEVYFDSFSNGDVLLASLRSGARTPSEATPDRWTLGRFTLDGDFREDLGNVRGMRRFNGNPIPFSPMPSVVVQGDSLYVADGYEAELAVRRAGDNTRRTIELAGLTAASSDGIWSSLEEELERLGRDLFLEDLEEDRVPREGRLPHIADLLVDDRGLIWVKRYEPVFDSIWLRTHTMWPAPGGEWWIVRPDGELVATVQLPTNVRPLDVRNGRILGVAMDAYDVERVVVHTLDR